MRELGRTIHQLQGWAHRTRRYFREGVRRFRLQGQLYGSGEKLQILVQGSEDSAISLGWLLFQEKPQYIPLMPEESFILGPEDDALVELKGPWNTKSRPDALEICCWLDAQMPAIDPELALAQSSKDFRRAYRQLVEREPSVRYTEDLGDWQRWYEEMLVPMAQSRHREKAKTPGLEELLSYADRATLGIVSLDGKEVAGGLVLPTRLTAVGRLWRIGMLPEIVADQRLYKGMNVYLDAMALQKTLELGLERFSLGLALARVDEGLFRYKTNWGCSLVYEPFGLIHRLSFASDAHRQRIIAQVPLFSLEKGEVVLHVAGPRTSLRELQNVRFPELKTIYIHDEIPAELLEKELKLTIKKFAGY